MVDLDTYCQRIGIQEPELKSHCTSDKLSLARQVYWHYLRAQKDRENKHLFTFKQIAGIFGRRSHSTVIHGVTIIKELIKIKAPCISGYLAALETTV